MHSLHHWFGLILNLGLNLFVSQVDIRLISFSAYDLCLKLCDLYQLGAAKVLELNFVKHDVVLVVYDCGPG